MIKEKNILHIFAQPMCHSDAYICGDQEALIKLRDALTLVIDGNETKIVAAAVRSMTNDGEDFDLFIVKTDMEEMMLPYTDESFFKASCTRPHPFEFIKKDYRKLKKIDD
jgi:hypothetical protein